MKKLLSVILSALLILSSFTMLGCNAKPEGKYTFYAPDGAPALAIAKFINDEDNLGLDKPVEYNVVAPANIGNAMSQGLADIMIIPINAASKLYKANQNDVYKMAGVVTHGNLYIMNSVGITDVDGLKGKVVGVLPNVPELTLKAVLKAKNIEYVNSAEAVSDKVALNVFSGTEGAANMISALTQGTLTIGLLAEPACTNLTTNASGKTWQRMDVQTLYDSQNNSFPQAVVMIKNSVLQNNSSLINTLASKINENVTWAKENISTAVSKVASKLPNGVTPSMNANNINADVISNCKIFWQGVSQAKELVKGYVQNLVGVEQTSAKVITDDFFA